MRSKYKVFVAGGGGIGRAVALLLSDDPALLCDVFIGDIYQSSADDAVQWVKTGIENDTQVNSVLMPADGITSELEQAFAESDIILDCLPGSQAPRMARFAMQFGMHYANLTEYVAETNEIISFSTIGIFSNISFSNVFIFNAPSSMPEIKFNAHS